VVEVPVVVVDAEAVALEVVLPDEPPHAASIRPASSRTSATAAAELLLWVFV
jgi:hypothetical protein